MLPVVIESPYAGDVGGNLKYLHLCIADSLSREEAPFASHVLYTRALDDTKPAERAKGIHAGLEWARLARKSVVYADRGISKGMALGIDHALQCGRPVDVRVLARLPGEALDTLQKLSSETVEAARAGTAGEEAVRLARRATEQALAIWQAQGCHH